MTPMLAVQLIYSLCAWWAIILERRAPDRELFEKRLRHYRGGDL